MLGKGKKNRQERSECRGGWERIREGREAKEKENPR